MKVKSDAILINKKDNVAVALRDLKEGDDVLVKGDEGEFNITISSDINFGHKIALIDFFTGDNVIKYGEIIGVATADIEKGDLVNHHKIVGLRGKFNK